MLKEQSGTSVEKITRPGLIRKQKKLTKCYNFTDRISFAKQWKLVDESSEFHLALSRTHRVHFPNSKYAHKKAGHLK